MYGLQYGALAHTEQQSVNMIKGPKITSVKPFKQENSLLIYIKERETGINYSNKRQLLYIRFLT